MLALLAIGLAAAACVLPAEIDPNAVCVEDANGFATLDADSDTDIPISLTIATKGETTDAFKVLHPATAGDLTDFTETDGRYILACPQAAGLKTVEMTITRPADLTAFGAEWVQLFPKDSWYNTTNEYEPFTFNNYGAKVPLAEFRPTSNGLEDDATNMPVLHVFMEVSGEGDYEVKYGNPSLVSNEKWVAVEFKSTLLRVGAPWADCSGSELAAPSYAVGSIMPILFGGPNLNSVALMAGKPSYYDAIAELSGVSVPVKVVLEIFNADKTAYTSSVVDDQCYKAGPACPEKHHVCKPEYCEMDVWAEIIAGFKAASPGMVTVLGSLDSSTHISMYDDFDLDGFYFATTTWPTGTPAHSWDVYYGKCSVGGSPLVGQAQPDGASSLSACKAVCASISTCTAVEWAAFPTTPARPQCKTFSAEEIGASSTAGCGTSSVTLNGGNTGENGPVSSGLSECPVAVNKHNWDTSYSEPYNDAFTVEVRSGAAYVTRADSPGNEWGMRLRFHCASGAGCTLPYSTECHVANGYMGTYSGPSVSAIGTPLFDAYAVDDASVYVTLAEADLGLWNPFSWYPSVAPSKWAAMVTEAIDTDAIATLFDRGYGWVFLTSEEGFATKSTMTPAVLAEIEATATARRLQERRLTASEPFWGCDDTLLECKPICQKKMGVVTSKVSDKLCAGAPMDQCACKCYHEAQWTCGEGEEVVCKAKFGAGELERVGDKVCEMRGAPKPASIAELRVASECEPVTEMRGSAPAEDCFAQWRTPEPAKPTEPAEPTPDYDFNFLPESLAAPLAFAMLALFA